MKRLAAWKFALVLVFGLGVVAAVGQTIHALLTSATVPLPVNSCIQIDQGPGTDAAACQDSTGTYWARLFGVLSTNTLARRSIILAQLAR